MKEKLVVIDGNSIINRAFYGLPDLTTTDGRHTNAVLGFINILIRITTEEKPNYLAVAFDVKHPTFRHEMFPEYKGTRKGMPPELSEQVPRLKEMLAKMGVLTIECPGFEADDILGALAAKGKRDDKKVTLVSGDRDLLQLCNDEVMVRLPKTTRGGTEVEDYTPARVLEEFGVTPPHIVDLKGLMGDSSDNIPGVPGVGPKTAQKLLAEYETVEEVLAAANEIKPEKLSEKLQANADLALLSKKLATIRTDWEPEFSYEKAAFGDIFTDEAYHFCQELELKSLLTKYFRAEQGREDVARSFGDAPENTDTAGLKKLLEGMKTEFVGFAAFENTFLFSDGRKGYSVDFENAEKFAKEAADFLHGLCGAGIKPVCFDLKKYAGLVMPQDQTFYKDASLGAYLLNPLKNSYTYEDIARDYLGMALPSPDMLLKSPEPVQLSLFDSVINEDEKKKDETALKIAFYEAMTAQAAYPELQKRLRAENMLELYETMELPLVFTLFDMETAGMLVKPDVLSEYSAVLSEGIHKLEQDIYRMAGEEFNINSPKQLGVILFEKLKLPYGKKTKTGYSTSADILEKLRIEDPIVEAILDYRQLMKLKSTYADGLTAFIQKDGRIHSQFKQMVTATGRLSSAEPNLQNIPVKMEMGRKIRKAFVPADGYCFVDADYSQIELRILAHLSKDERLIDAYREAADIHRMTASLVFHVPYDEVTPLQRSNAKAVNFGIVYGISSFGLGQDLNISKKDAQTYIDSYFETYPKIKSYLDGLIEKAKTDGYVETMFGRRRPVPEIGASNFMMRSFGERIAMNSPVQGTAADIMKIAMIRVNARLKKELPDSRMVLQVHDELLIEAKREDANAVKEILKQEMSRAAELSVPLEVSLSEGDDWYETK